MTVVFLILILLVSFLVVRVGAIVLEFTGMKWEQAKFQALSAFTNSGFTTRESEAIMQHPLRRSVVSYLIILGNAGLVTMVGTFALTVLNNSALNLGLNLILIVLTIIGLIWLARKPNLTSGIRKKIRKWLIEKYPHYSETPSELLHLFDGYTLTKVIIPNGATIHHKKLNELELKQRGLQILAIERGTHFIPIPRGNEMLEQGDKLVVYGDGKTIQEYCESVFGKDETERD